MNKLTEKTKKAIAVFACIIIAGTGAIIFTLHGGPDTAVTTATSSTTRETVVPEVSTTAAAVTETSTTAVVTDVPAVTTTSAATTTTATTDATTRKQTTENQPVYTEADALKFRNEIEAYAVSKGYTIDRSLGADNSEWGAMEWGIGPGWSYEQGMSKAKSEIDFHAQGSWNERINVIYFYSGDGWWTFLPYCM